MLREVIKEFSSTLWQMVYLIATAGTFIMVVAFFANRSGLQGKTFWMAMTVLVPLCLLGAMGVVLVSLDFNSPNFDPALYVVAGNAFLSAEEAAKDNSHYIESMEQHVDLTNGAQDVVLTERYKGRNVRQEPSAEFRIYLDSETFLSDEVTITQHFEDGSSEQLEVNKIQQEGGFVGIYGVKFKDPIERNELFEIEVKSHLGDWSIDDGQVLHFDFNRFERGVGQATCGFSVDTPPESVSAYSAVDQTDMTHHRDPMELDFEFTEIEVHSTANNTEHEISGQNLRNHIYIMTFR